VGFVNSQASSGPPGPAFVKFQSLPVIGTFIQAAPPYFNLDCGVVGRNIVPSRYASVCCS